MDAMEKERMENKRMSVDVMFEAISITPFSDIMLVGSECSRGVEGIARCFDMLNPGDFEFVDLREKNMAIEGMIINKKIYKKISKQKVQEIIEDKVLPYVSPREYVKVDIKAQMMFNLVEVDEV